MTPSNSSPARPSFFLRWRAPLFLLAGLLIIAGIRLALVDRFSSTIPIADDWQFIDFLENWSRGNHDWSFLFHRHNDAHLTLFSRLVPALSVQMNGLWDHRLDSLFHLLVYAAYALLAAVYFSRIVPERATLLRGMVLFFFAIPFAGFRVAWAFLNAFDFCCLFAYLAFLLFAWNRGKLRWSLPLALLMLVCSSFSLGSGCLAGLAIASVAGLEMLTNRRVDRTGLLWLVPGAVIFLAFYLTMGKPADPAPFNLMESIGAMCKALAWPASFFAPGVVAALVPFVVFIVKYWKADAEFRSSGAVRALMLAWAWLLLQGLAIGFMRGENNNMGIPSNRYNDLLMPLVFVEAATFLLFTRAPSSRGIRLAGAAWVLLILGGLLAHLLWRTWPFAARENGENNEWVRQRNIRLFFEGNPEPLRTAQRENQDSSVIHNMGDRLEPFLAEVADGKWNIATRGSLSGLPLKFPEGAAAAFQAHGVPPEYYAFPQSVYFGSFTSAELEGTKGTARSEPFPVHSEYLTFDLIVDKKARFTNYKLPGLSLKLVPESGGEAVDVLAGLGKQVPFLLRDRESVCVKVTPGASYHLECDDESKDLWLSFSQPMEGGRCAGWLHQLMACSKLLILAGIMLFTLLFLTRPSTTSSHG
ncbi:MAG TPA: hypothetical protein VHM91_21555 [Verrucomicrobiales bacterium]|nr:hypothetical protein [Verrucomicrobiales bacterium]